MLEVGDRVHNRSKRKYGKVTHLAKGKSGKPAKVCYVLYEDETVGMIQQIRLLDIIQGP